MTDWTEETKTTISWTEAGKSIGTVETTFIVLGEDTFIDLGETTFADWLVIAYTEYTEETKGTISYDEESKGTISYDEETKSTIDWDEESK